MMYQVGCRMLLVRVAIYPTEQDCVVVRHLFTIMQSLVVGWRNFPPVVGNCVTPFSLCEVNFVYVTPLLPAALGRRWEWSEVPGSDQWIELYVSQALCAY